MARCIAEQCAVHHSITQHGAQGDPYFFEVPDEAEEPEGGIQAPDPGETLKDPQWGEEEYIPEVTSLMNLIETEQDCIDFLSSASGYIAKHMEELVGDFYRFFVAEVIQYSARALAVKKGKTGWEKASRREIETIIEFQRRSLRDRIKVRAARRPKWSGSFESEQHFLTALIEVLSSFDEKPTQSKVWQKLSHHDDFNGEPIKHLSESHGKTLRNWLNKIRLSWDEVLEKYWDQTRTGK